VIAMRAEMSAFFNVNFQLNPLVAKKNGVQKV
jgi:hypothetical protein